MPDATRIATVQAEPVWFDLAATTDKTLDLIADAARGGAQLVAFPETWLPGYPLFLWSHTPADQVSFVAGYHLNSVDVNGSEIERIRQSARANQIWVVLGISERLHGTLYISELIIDDEGVVRLHRRKLKPTHVERSLFGEGDGSGLQVVETPFGRVGGLNCWEHLQPLVKFAMYAQNEQIHVASWPCFSIPAHHYTLTSDASLAASQTYAMEGGCFVLVANQVMTSVGAQRLGVPVEILAAGAGAGGRSRLWTRRVASHRTARRRPGRSRLRRSQPRRRRGCQSLRRPRRTLRASRRVPTHGGSVRPCSRASDRCRAYGGIRGRLSGVH